MGYDPPWSSPLTNAMPSFHKQSCNVVNYIQYIVERMVYMCVKIDNPDLAAPKSGVRKFSKSPKDELLPIALPDTAPP